MKAGNGFWKWRSAVGTVAICALAFGVSVQGGPRVTDDSATRTKGSKASRLTTGPVDHLNQVITAGDATLQMLVTPQYSHPDGTYNTSYSCNGGLNTGDDCITGQLLQLDSGSLRAYLNVQVHDWAASGLPMRSFQHRVDAMGYMSGAGDPLALAVEGCAGPAECITDWGEKGAKCTGGLCTPGWINKGRPDGLFFEQSDPDLGCGATWDVGTDSPIGVKFFGTTEAAAGCAEVDDGKLYYAGSMCLEVPGGAKGLYTIGLVEDETFAADDSPTPVNIPVAEYIAAQIEITTGACCTNIGPDSSVCNAPVTKAECDALPTTNTRIFTPGENDCGTFDCPSCREDFGAEDCNDNDSCTDDSCVAFICFHDPIAAWDTDNDCCDGSGPTPATCTPANPNTCVNQACTSTDSYGGRGTCDNTPIGAGEPCNEPGDDNPCTMFDVCDGSLDDNCAGEDVNAAMIMCDTDEDCRTATELSAPVCIDNLCECSLVPDLIVNIDPSGKANDKCFDSGDDGAKVTANVFVAAATAPVNGGQFLINYDPTCLDYNSVEGVAPYTDLVYGPVVDEGAGTIFVVVGVGFGAEDGPAGNADMLSLSFTKVGDCNSCQICFSSNNPQNTYLVDNTGQRIEVNPLCSNAILANNDNDVDVPGGVKTNVDCDQPSAVETWDAPTCSDECGNSTLMCQGQHESGLIYSNEMVMGGGEFAEGISNFCCWCTSDTCGSVAGCAEDVAAAAHLCEEGCWTVEVNDETSLDIVVGLSPTQDSKPGDELTRCIKFTLYPNTYQEPFRFTEDITFGGMLDFVGKSKDKIKIPGSGNWDCISAWDQLHTLRSCYLFGPDDCVDGQLSASFRGDPAFGGNWLIGGNLDGWKKDVAGSAPSLFVIDILDYGTFVSQWGMALPADTPCGTDGPHSDIDGDGMVGLSDYAFIDLNFLTTAKLCCGVDGLPAAITPLEEVTLRDLREMGRSDLAVADLNGDGVLNVADMNAFMQGVRPSKKVDRTSRKGMGTR